MKSFFYFLMLFAAQAAQSQKLDGDWLCLRLEYRIMREYMPQHQDKWNLRIANDSIQLLEYPCQLYAKIPVPAGVELKNDTLKIDFSDCIAYYTRSHFDPATMSEMRDCGLHLPTALAYKWALVRRYDFDGDDEPIQKISYPKKMPAQINFKNTKITEDGCAIETRLGGKKRVFYVEQFSAINEELWLKPAWLEGEEAQTVWYKRK